MNAELQHRIENMEIHKLMDLVDAPRIMLPIPTPATIAQWAVASWSRSNAPTLNHAAETLKSTLKTMPRCKPRRMPQSA